MTGTRPRDGGFTLLELVIVVLLLGMAAGVAVPALSRLDMDDPVAGAVRDVERLLSRARLTAAERAVSVRVVVDVATARYEATASSHTGRDIVLPFAQGTLDLPMGVALAATRPLAVFTFDPLGPAAGDTVRVVGPSGEVRVVVDPWTGEARALP